MNDRSLNSLTLDGGSELTLGEAETLAVGDVLESGLADIYDLCVEIQTRISELEARGDEHWKTADLSSIPSAVWNYGTASDRVVTAENAEISGGTQIDADAVASAVWNSPKRELTQDAALASDLNAAKTEILTKCATATGFATPEDVPTAEEISAAAWNAETRTLTAVGSSGIATASSLSKLKAAADAIQSGAERTLALISNWELEGSVLTAYDSQGEELGSWTVSKNSEGEINRVVPQ